jgi:predicted DNA-binding transcriptional regulator AlpA
MNCSVDRRSLRMSEAAELLGYSSSSFRRLVAAGALPGPIDPALPPKLRRWSRRMLERYTDPDLTVAVDADPTPAHGLVRPDLRVVGE